MKRTITLRTATLLLLCLLLTAASSCKKYRIQNFGCKDDPFHEDGMYMPNFFSPNSDGVNDLLVFHHDSVQVSNFSFIVKNVFGVKVFETSEPDIFWMGRTKKGRDLKADNYKYEMCFDANGKHYHVKKTISLYKWPYGDFCIKNSDDCATGNQWDGVIYNPLLPSNEFYGCD